MKRSKEVNLFDDMTKQTILRDNYSTSIHITRENQEVEDDEKRDRFCF